MDAFDRWAVRSNLERIAAGETTVEETVANLRRGGYDDWADAVAAHAEAAELERARRVAWRKEL